MLCQVLIINYQKSTLVGGNRWTSSGKKRIEKSEFFKKKSKKGRWTLFADEGKVGVTNRKIGKRWRHKVAMTMGASGSQWRPTGAEPPRIAPSHSLIAPSHSLISPSTFQAFRHLQRKSIGGRVRAQGQPGSHSRGSKGLGKIQIIINAIYALFRGNYLSGTLSSGCLVVNKFHTTYSTNAKQQIPSRGIYQLLFFFFQRFCYL